MHETGEKMNKILMCLDQLFVIQKLLDYVINLLSNVLHYITDSQTRMSFLLTLIIILNR